MPKAELALTGTWQFKEYPPSARRMRDLEDGGWLETQVPCSIYTALIKAGQIDRTDIDANPENYVHISDKPWVFKKTFEVSDDILNCDRMDLIFEGLDTIAGIWLNEKLIARTNNMFIPHRFNVKPYLKSAGNVLLVRFDPAPAYARKLMRRYTEFSAADTLNPHRAYIRKAQYQFGWDWGPALPGCGIWRPVRLQGIKTAAIRNVNIQTMHCQKSHADVKATIELDAMTDESITCHLKVLDPSGNVCQEYDLEPHNQTCMTVIGVDVPKLWWPRGYGQPDLYTLQLQLISDGETVDEYSARFGIRTVKLNQDQDQYGHRFCFEVNSQPVYARGANWIPVSIFAGSVTDADYEQLLRLTVGANMNMLRVWGGGYYENEKFYQLCDELGIMVWQDFMFACSLYPQRDFFLDQVRTEAKTVIESLRNHPGIVIWCGNNEIHWQHYSGTYRHVKKFHGKRIFEDLLPNVLLGLDPDRPYIPSSPISMTADPNDPASGCVHNWHIWAGNKPVRDYVTDIDQIPRFVTEFGMQSLPQPATIKKFSPLGQLYPGSAAVEKHNYQIDGNSRIYRYLGDLFGLAQNIERMAYLSQVTQARGIKTYVEFLRANNWRNSGAMFWQLNDCCPAISWSAVDYTRYEKALWYYARRFFAGQLVVAVPELDRSRTGYPPKLACLSVVAVNDTPEPLTGTIRCRLIDLLGRELDTIQLPTAIAPFSNSKPVKLPKAFIFPIEPYNCALHLELETPDAVVADNLFLFVPDKHLDWPNTDIKMDMSSPNDNSAVLTLSCGAIAKDVMINAGQAKLNDNFVDLIPNRPREIQIEYEQPAESVQPPSIMHVRAALRE